MASEDGQLLKALKDFKQQRIKVEAELNGIVGRLQALELEEQDCMRGAASRAELVTALCARITRLAHIGRRRICETITPDANALRANRYSSVLTSDVISMQRISDTIEGLDDLGHVGNALISAADPRAMNAELTFDGIAIATLFEDQLKASVKRCVDDAPWPWPEPKLSIDERRKRLAEIEVERTELEQRKAVLVDLIAEAMMD